MRLEVRFFDDKKQCIIYMLQMLHVIANLLINDMYRGIRIYYKSKNILYKFYVHANINVSDSSIDPKCICNAR